MSFDDSFRERVILNSDETYEICRIRSNSEIYDLAGLGDPMTQWQERAEKLGTTIVPRQVYLVNLFEQHEHRVAWVYHSAPRGDYVEDYHHIACDCVATMEEPDKELEEIVGCPAVLAALEHRATRVNEVFGTRGIFDFYGQSREELSPRNYARNTAKALINFVLQYENAHPEGWVANTVSGEHQVPLLAAVLQVPPYPIEEDAGAMSLQEVVEEMHIDGSLVLHDDGTTVSLPKAA